MKPNEITIADFLTRLAIAAVLGIAIGYERQWRQRAAGLHTSSLVSIGAALFALLDTMMNAGDTTRIVAGVVTGVGFIAGGVILKSGSNISGLNTAATMWATAAVGALAGFGLWWEAAAAAAAVIVLNLVLQPVADAINRRSKRTQESETHYRLTVICQDPSRTAVSAAIVQAVSATELALQSLTQVRIDATSAEVRADLLSSKPENEILEDLSSRLLSNPGVQRTDWETI